tara:strand:+ start:154 stop:333 length:180 start_codon:yes stop_codon:yes gene_type:complete
MWRIYWEDDSKWYEFDNQAALVTWAKDKATHGDPLMHSFTIQEQIDGSWTRPNSATSFN